MTGVHWCFNSALIEVNPILKISQVVGMLNPLQIQCKLGNVIFNYESVCYRKQKKLQGEFEGMVRAAKSGRSKGKKGKGRLKQK